MCPSQPDKEPTFFDSEKHYVLVLERNTESMMTATLEGDPEHIIITIGGYDLGEAPLLSAFVDKPGGSAETVPELGTCAGACMLTRAGRYFNNILNMSLLMSLYCSQIRTANAVSVNVKDSDAILQCGRPAPLTASSGRRPCAASRWAASACASSTAGPARGQAGSGWGAGRRLGLPSSPTNRPPSSAR